MNVIGFASVLRMDVISLTEWHSPHCWVNNSSLATVGVVQAKSAAAPINALEIAQTNRTGALSLITPPNFVATPAFSAS